MTTVTGLTAARMLAIEAASVIDGDVVGDELILAKRDGTQINAGNVRGPKGDQGPTGSVLSVISAASIFDVGIANQICAGRQLTAADFTNMGLSAPIGLWNLTDLTDVSGNGRNLTLKANVASGAGINGVAATAQRFLGLTTSVLYIADTGVADTFRIVTGSWGSWFKSSKLGTFQTIMGKMSSGAGNWAWRMYISDKNVLASSIYFNGTANPAGGTPVGLSNVCDDRWHFGVITYDGNSLCIYVDGTLEIKSSASGLLFASAGPFNIGGYGADGSTPTVEPFFGRVDEAFVTADVLSEEEIRNLYCAKIPHALGVVPTRVSLNVRRRRRGPALVSSDFTTQPVRLHNFSAGALTDAGSGNVALTNSNAAKTVAGADGTVGNAFAFDGVNQALSSTDTGLPAGTTSRSWGCWLKLGVKNAWQCAMGWGTQATMVRVMVESTGMLHLFHGVTDLSGPYIADGNWHFVTGVYNDSAGDGVRTKVYVDGGLVIIGTASASITLGGANRFAIGMSPDGVEFFTGSIDAVFVCAYAMTAEEVKTLYNKGSQILTPSPKNPGDHVEAMNATDLLAIFDSLDGCHQVDIGVS